MHDLDSTPTSGEGRPDGSAPHVDEPDTTIPEGNGRNGSPAPEPLAAPSLHRTVIATTPAEPTAPGIARPPAPSTNSYVHTDPGSDAAVFVDAWHGHRSTERVREGRRRRSHSLRVTREVVETAILALVIFVGVRAVVQNFRVEGASMEPNFHTGQYVLVNKLLYTRLDRVPLVKWLPFVDESEHGDFLFHPPKRGDVVVFEPPIPNSGERDFIKRVIGEPGEHVLVKDGRIYINGLLLEEQYLPGIQTFCGGQWCDVTLGEDEYYVMGDNRGNSSDSKLWGPIKSDNIIGKAWLIYLPFSDFGKASHEPPSLVQPGATSRP